MKVFVFDSSKCNGCYGCQLACKDEHWNNTWLPWSLPQPDTGHFWCRVKQRDHGQTPKVRVEYKPVLCNHCDKCELLDKAPDLAWRTQDGFVIIDPQKAKGHRELVDMCPYGHIYWNDELDIAQKCTGCPELVEDGELPHCVDVCATGALRFGEAEDFADEIALAETEADKALGPHVFYTNMPHLFIGGEVWDPATDEIIEGAKIVLSGDACAQTTSDEFGDFWFRKLDEGSYHIQISAEGFECAEIEFRLDESLNVGDFPLKRAVGNEAVAQQDDSPSEFEKPIDTPDVEVKEVGDVTAAMSVMSQAPDESGGVMDTSGIASQ